VRSVLSVEERDKAATIANSRKTAVAIDRGGDKIAKTRLFPRCTHNHVETDGRHLEQYVKEFGTVAAVNHSVKRRTSVYTCEIGER